eukprot:scaffold99528_cov56-Cyclotella_meneghiniana.AAC.2
MITLVERRALHECYHYFSHPHVIKTCESISAVIHKITSGVILFIRRSCIEPFSQDENRRPIYENICWCSRTYVVLIYLTSESLKQLETRAETQHSRIISPDSAMRRAGFSHTETEYRIECYVPLT